MDSDSRRHDDDGLAEARMLVDGLAHELKNPLSTMYMTLQLLREEWAEKKGDTASRSVRKIDVILEEMRRLEQMLQDFMRLAAKPQLDRRREDVNGLLDEVVEFLGPEFSQRRIAVTTHLDRGISAVTIDRNRIKQVFLNLFRNACEALEEGGSITVMTREANGFVTIEIIDTGHGMSDETKANAFGAYYSTKPQGSGLGLPLVRLFVEQHGGSVAFDSAPGFGTKFTVALPSGTSADGGR